MSLGATAVEFDFAAKQERAIPVEEVPAACEQGLCCWVDIDVDDPDGAAAVLNSLGVNRVAIDEALSQPIAGRHDVYDDCLHVAVAAASFETGRIAAVHLDLVLGEHFIVSLHRGRVDFLEHVRRRYRQDFVKFGQTLSFLLYEVWDHLIDAYRKGLRELTERVERVQSRIFDEANDQIFGEVSGLTHDLLVFRKYVLAARDVLQELAIRRSPFVSETCRPFLQNMLGTLERLASDLTVEREALAETLNLHMGIVSHRTNRVINRLTLLSAIFLPLTFLCGVYGMNFENLPEVKWQYGYFVFWLLATAISVGLLVLFRVKRWL